MDDCYQENCPWRKNETSSIWRCECLGCPNRDEGFLYYTTTEWVRNEAGEALWDCKTEPQLWMLIPEVK